MLRQDELVFLKVIFTLEVSPALLKELSLAFMRSKKKPVLPAGKCSTTSGSGTRYFQELVPKLKSNEVA